MNALPSLRAALSRTLRHFIPLVLALATATCTQDHMGPSEGGVGYFAFRPSYQLPAGVSLAQFGIVADSIRVRLTRPVDELVLDTTVFFPPDSTELRLTLPITLAKSPDTLDAIITISADGVVLFQDSIRTEVVDGPPDPDGIPPVVFEYVGPGLNIGFLDIAPEDTTVFLGDTLFFTAQAFDSSEVEVASFYVSWRTSDTAVAKITPSGRLIAPNVRATVDVIGTTPTGIADTTSITFAPTPVIVTADSGDAQTGTAGDSLPVEFVARVKAADSLGVAGIPVRFAVVSGNGALRDTLVYTDVNGRVRTRAAFDTTTGAYSWSATAVGTGLPAVTFTATAAAGAPTSIALQGGDAQTDTVAQLLPAPFVARVADAFGNPVPGVAVVFARAFGGGTLADDTLLTDASGLATVGYTLGGSVGTDSVTATIAGTSAFVTFTATGVADAPATIQEFDGSGQSIAVNTAYPESLLVRVFDAHDNPVPGAAVVWTIFAGQGSLALDTTTTDSTGSTRNELTAGTLAGMLQVEVRPVAIPNGITMTNTVLAGPAAELLIGAGNGQTGAAGAPVAVVPSVIVRDAFENPVPNGTVTFTVTAGGGTIDSLSPKTDSTGTANVGAWVLGPTAGSNQLRATSAAVPTDTLLFDAVAIPAGTSKLWTGASSSLWTDGSNWDPAGAPGITDNIFVPASATSPLLDAATTIGDLIIENGASLTANALFTVSGDLDINGTLGGSGGVTVTGTSTLFHGSIGNPIVNVSGTRTLSGATSVAGALNVTSGVLTIGGQDLTVGGNLSVQSTGRLAMTAAGDSVDVAGNATFSSGTAGVGDLTAGVLVLRGNFTQSSGAFDNFQASGAHLTRFAGSSAQTISVSAPNPTQSRFQDVEFANAAGISLATNFSANGTVTVSAGTVNGNTRSVDLAGGLVTPYAAWQVSNTRWSTGPAVYPDSLPRNVQISGTWGMTHGFKTDSALTVTATGVINGNGQHLRIGGNFTQSGLFRMPTAADTVEVGGAMLVNGGLQGIGDLNAGLLVIGGNFTQSSGAFENFQPSGTHLTRFAGSAPQTISISAPNPTQSRFQELEFANPAGVTFATNFSVMGTTTVSAGTVTGVGRSVDMAGGLVTPYAAWQVSTTRWNADPGTYPDSLPRSVQLTSTWNLTHGLRVDSAFTVTSSGALNVNGQHLSIGANFTQTGEFRMLSSADTVEVGGAMTVNGAPQGIADLTAGLLILRGDFTQSSGAFENFQPSGTHLTRFAGSALQTVSISAPSLTQSRFNHVEFANPANVQFSTNFGAVGTTSATAGQVLGATRTATLAGSLVSTNTSWQVGTTAFSATPATYPDSLALNLTLAAPLTLAHDVTVGGNLVISSAGDLTIGGQALTVGGNLTQTGTFQMVDPADSVDIGGGLTVNSAVNGADDLTDGVLFLRGGLTQSAGAFENFAPSTAHRTVFGGTGGHTVSFASPSATQSRFHILEVSDSLTLTSAMSATGPVTMAAGGRFMGPARTATLYAGLSDTTFLGWRVANTINAGRFQSLPTSLTTNLTISDTFFVAAPMTVTGNVAINGIGYLNLTGHSLVVSGNFTQGANLGMFASGDSLDVAGDFTVNSGEDGTGDLVAGVIRIGGNFTQSAGAFENFVATAPHRTMFHNTAVRSLSFASPAQSRFGDLDIEGGTVLSLGSDVDADGTFKAGGGTPVTLQAAAQRRITSTGLGVDGATFDRVRIRLNALTNGAQFDNVTFANQDPTQVQLSLEFPGQSGDTIKFDSVTFGGVPTSGGYVYATDSVANDGVATIAFYNSAPLNGAAFTATEGSVGDLPNVLWSRLEWQQEPLVGTELLPFIPTPEVRAVDPSGIVLAGYTGLITLAFDNDPTGGLAALAGNAENAVAGVASFDALTISAAGALFTLRPSSPELGVGPATSPFTVDVPMPSGTTTAFNNGGGDNDWDNASNWTFGVPDSADNIYIQPGQAVTVNTPARGNNLTIGSGGTILLNAPLTVDSSVSAGTTITGGGQLIAQGSGLLSGQVGDLLVTGNYSVPSGEQLTAQSVNISGGSAVLDPGQATITAFDSLRTEAGGKLNIGYPGATVNVQGRARFTGGASALTAGTLYIGGDFSQEENAGAFAADTAFTTIFNGGGVQTASFFSTDSLFSPDSASDHFGHLMLTGGGTLHLAGIVPVLGGLDLSGGTVVADSITFIGGDVTGSTGAFLQGYTLQVAGDLGFGGVYGVAHTVLMGTGQTVHPLSSGYDTLSVTGTALLGGNITANVVYVFGDGQLSMGGRRLDVAADFGTFGNGVFGMQDPADTLIVGGNFTAGGGPTTGLLTAGLLQVSGSFIQGFYTGGIPVEVQGPLPPGDGFNADSGHVTRFVGGALPRLIFFSNPLQPPGAGGGLPGATSKFGTLELVDGIDSLASVVPVIEDVSVGSATVFGDGTLAAVGSLDVAAGGTLAMTSLYSSGNITFAAPPSNYTVYETFFFGGNTVPDLPYQWLRIGYTAMALAGDLTAGQITLGGQGEGPGDSYPGHLDLNGHTVTTTGDFSLTGFGTLQMTQPTDSLDVGGNLSAAGGSTAGLVTDGALVVRGSLYLNSNWTDTGFVATGAHRTVMAGTFSDLWISTSPTAVVGFNKFTVLAGNTVNYDPFSDGPLVVGDSLVIEGSFQQGNSGRRVYAKGPFDVRNGANFQVDTLELHQGVAFGDASLSVPWVRYAGTGQTISTAFSYNTLEVTGTAGLDAGTTFVGQDAIVSGNGSLAIGPSTLSVARALRTTDLGQLSMTDPTGWVDADTAFFGGGSTSGLLTAGTLRTRSLIQDGTNSASSYAADGAHLTQIGTPLGGTNYQIQMANGEPGGSTIGRLLFNDGGFGSVPTQIIGTVRVLGRLETASEGTSGVNGGPGTKLILADSLVNIANVDFAVDTLELWNGISTGPNSLASAVTRFGGSMFIPDSQAYQQVQVTGFATVEGSVVAGSMTVQESGRLTIVNNDQLIVNGDFTTKDFGALEMAGLNADLFIGGNATFQGGSTSGLLTAGRIRVVGDFTQLPGSAASTFAATNTVVWFQGGAVQQQVTITDGTVNNFRAVSVTNPLGIDIHGYMLVTDSVGTAGPIVGDTLAQFGNLFLNAGASLGMRVLYTSGLYSGTPSSYTVGRTHLVIPNTIPNVAFDTLVINTTGASVFYPLNVGTLIVAGPGSPFNHSGGPASLDLGVNSFAVTGNVSGDLRIEGTGAQLAVAEDTLHVGGDLYTSLGGTVSMTGNGLLDVAGSTLFGGASQIGLMTAGTLQVGSGITQQAFSSPSSFRLDGTQLVLPLGPAHVLNFETPDSSWLPDLAPGSQGTLSLVIIKKARVAGGISAYGVSISGDTLITTGQLSGGPSGLSVNLGKYVGPVMYQFQSLVDWNVATTQFTQDGQLPFLDLTFDTLLVSAQVGGQLSQTLTMNRLEVTGPGNPRHQGAGTGRIDLVGYDGNTYIKVQGDVIVRGNGARIWNSAGAMDIFGDLVVDQNGEIESPGYDGDGLFDVEGNVTIDGACTDSLVAGRLYIAGSFTQKGTTCGGSYTPKPGFVTQFTGDGGHSIFFETPSSAVGTGSYFGGLAVGGDFNPQQIDFEGDYWVEGGLATTSSFGAVFHNTRTGLSRITVQDVAVQNITFDHVQLRLQKQSAAAPGFGSMDVVGFTNFLTTEDQFVVDLPGQAAGGFSWSNFTWTQLDLGGTDTGHYIVATDTDGSFPFLGISIGSNQTTSGDLGYYVGLNGATVTPFAP